MSEYRVQSAIKGIKGRGQTKQLVFRTTENRPAALSQNKTEKFQLGDDEAFGLVAGAEAEDNDSDDDPF